MSFTDVVTLGETMGLMKAETPGPLAQVHSLSLGMGGSESNFAIALRRLGTSVTWVGRVGNDSLGELVLRELAAEGVVVDPCVTVGTHRPHDQRAAHHGPAQGLVLPGRKRGLPAQSGGHPGRTDHQRPAAAPHGHHAGPFAGGRAAQYALDVARQAGVLVSFDLNYRAALWSPDEAGEVFRSFIAQADIVFAGDDEAAIAVGKSDDSLELARRVAALGPGQAIIKRGAQGCAAVIDGVEYKQDAVRDQRRRHRGGRRRLRGRLHRGPFGR